MMEIVNMKMLSNDQLTQAAQMLTDELPLGWATFDNAMEELDELGLLKNNSVGRNFRPTENDEDSIFLAAVENGEVLGWCGILSQYNGNVYEIHPLVVRGDQQRRGIGGKLMDAITIAAREKGALTLMLGADDEAEDGETSFANVDLYDNLPKQMTEFNPGTHQSAFYLRHGFKVVGVMPDANGKGKPDIMMAKALKEQNGPCPFMLPTFRREIAKQFPGI